MEGEPGEEEHLLLFPATPAAAEIRRKICSGGCDRPVKVCLCEKIPREPIPTTTQIVILQHPHEQRQKLATVPVLKKCLENCEIIVGRRLRRGHSPILDSLYQESKDSADSTPVCRAVFLFPGTELMPSIEINEWRSSSKRACIDGSVLIVFDGTWKHAKEMMFASLPFISKFATRVCFGCEYEVDGGSIYDSDLILKKEPFKGCMSTMEAVARALGVLETSGVEIEAKLVEVLKSMVSLQACYLKPMKPRKKLLGKGMVQKTNIEAAD
ncbi:hypothetical protein SOVF_020460 [Spinacia oleracea]|uniref:tRNA-uridine aminocarboxypropyltransferase n=1 Tax=Spinacia oleracea TaxID=3562 RepID=A0A9R0HYP0_SPIOL|nr:tRNA-uridine aminocarboxypropyltransferase A isoform X2 [Spinacia oleracea]KNA23955.1 hypothetical protein SOVF_020460 [Spinacia oleracea]